MRVLAGRIYHVFITPLNLVFHILFKRKPFEVTDQKQLWQSRREIDWNQINAVEADAYYKGLDSFVAEKLKGFDAKIFLEIGCYYGYRLNKFSSQVPDGTFYGMDIGIDNLILGAKEVVFSENAAMVNGNACDLPFKDKSVNAVYTVVCLTHINHSMINKAINELIRVCAKDLLLVEVDCRPMSLGKKIECINWGHGYMHEYDKLIGERMKCVSITPLIDDDNHPRYTAFHFSVP